MDLNLIINIITVAISALSSLALTNWRLQQLEKRVEGMEKIEEQISKLYTQIAVLLTDIKYIKESVEGFKHG